MLNFIMSNIMKKIIPSVFLFFVMASANACTFEVQSNAGKWKLKADEIKSITLYKVSEDKSFGKRILSFGTYPVISIISHEFGARKIFFEDNKEAVKSYKEIMKSYKVCHKDEI